jgi:hypothetical protein
MDAKHDRALRADVARDCAMATFAACAGQAVLAAT